MSDENILEKALEVLKERQSTHGPAFENLKVIAELWTAYLYTKYDFGAELRCSDVAIMMVFFKIGRSLANPKMDDFVDIAGYAQLAWEMIDVI